MGEPETDEWKTSKQNNLDDELDKAVFTEQVKMYMRRRRAFKDYESKMLTVTLGQC